MVSPKNGSRLQSIFTSPSWRGWWRRERRLAVQRRYWLSRVIFFRRRVFYGMGSAANSSPVRQRQARRQLRLSTSRAPVAAAVIGTSLPR